MPLPHKSAVRRVVNTLHESVNSRVFAWNARYSAISSTVLSRPFFVLCSYSSCEKKKERKEEKEKYHDRGMERVTGAPARSRLSQEVRETIIATSNFLRTRDSILPSRFLPSENYRQTLLLFTLFRCCVVTCKRNLSVSFTV